VQRLETELRLPRCLPSSARIRSASLSGLPPRTSATSASATTQRMMSDPTTGLSDPSADLATKLSESSLGTTQPPNNTGGPYNPFNYRMDQS